MNLMIEIKKTIELTKKDIEQIVSLKQQHWAYGQPIQMKWFYENIKENDYHVLVSRGGGLLAYLNIVAVDVIINKLEHGMFGIGNVCVNREYTHKGYGNILMAVTNTFVKENSKSAVLLCKKNLVDFYKNSGWIQINADRVAICSHSYSECLMAYDPRQLFQEERFTNISLNRNF